MSAHTPGPWKFDHWGSLIVDSGAGSSQLLIATVAINTYHDQGRYNAALIAAAPDLLAALAEMVKRIEYYTALGDACETNIEHWEYTAGSSDMERARIAIAKATGAA